MIRAGTVKEYKGRDEADYLPVLYSRNEIFVTGDAEFIRRVLGDRLTGHAGVVFIPQQLNKEDMDYYCGSTAGFIAGYTERSRFALRGHVIYPDATGLHVVNEKGRDELVASWARVEIAIETPVTNRWR